VSTVGGHGRLPEGMLASKRTARTMAYRRNFLTYSSSIPDIAYWRPRAASDPCAFTIFEYLHHDGHMPRSQTASARSTSCGRRSIAIRAECVPMEMDGYRTSRARGYDYLT